MGVDHQRPRLHARPIAGEKRGEPDRDGQGAIPGQSWPLIVETKRARALRRPDAKRPNRDAATGMPPSIDERLRIGPPARPAASRTQAPYDDLSPHERQTQLLRAAEEQRMATMVEARRRIRTNHEPAGDTKGKGAPKRNRAAVPIPIVPKPAVPDAIVVARSAESLVATSEAIRPQVEPEVARAEERQSPARRKGPTRRDILWRLSGLALLAAAGASSLIHRHVLSLTRNHAASALEMGLGLTSFVLASLGVLLMMYGAGLRDGWVSETDNRPGVRTGHRGGHPEETEHMDLAIFGSGREAIAALLAHRTQEHIARTPGPPARPR